jgi:hypothetical protein
MAMAIESSGLHERIAFKAMMLFGSDPKWYLILFEFRYLRNKFILLL